MAKFKRDKGDSSPTINTASLPDIIFMLLFFFMVVTVLRDSTLMVQVTVPKATELTKLEKKSLVNYIYVGEPKNQYQRTQGTAPRIQLGDKFASLADIPLFLEQHKASIPEPQHKLITSSFRVDQKVTMGIISDIKTELRKAGQLKVNYSANPRGEGGEF